MKSKFSYFFTFILAWHAIVGGAQTVMKVSVGQSHTLFLKSDGSLWAAGQNQNGQLGDGTLNDTNKPELIVASGVTAISAGGLHSLFLKQGGSLWAMGYDLDGQLGDGGNFATNRPEMIIPSGVTAISAGLYHSMFLKVDGSLWVMGDNDDGQLGNGSTLATNKPEMIVPSGVQAISAGNSYSMFIKTNGSLWVMGYSGDGALGNGTFGETNSPEMIESSNVVAIVAADDHALFVMSDGSVWDMGDNYFGELGIGNYNNTDVPVRNPTLSTNVTAVAGGEFFSVFLKNDGSLWGTGETAFGQLGDGTASLFRNTPEMIVPTNVIAISAGLDDTMFLMSDNTLWGMGQNQFGELGISTTNVLSPVQIVLPATPQFGALNVNLSPPGAISAGAQWQVDAGAFQNNGAIITGLSTGSHRVSFKTITGWITPVSQNVMIFADITNTANAVYGLADVTKPTLMITNVTAGMNVSNAAFTVKGTAGDNVAVSNVFYSLNNAAWTNATTLNNWSNWSATVTLVAGTNMIAAYAVDTTGNVSTTNTLKFVYVVNATLTVSINGLGTLAPDDNGALLQIGKIYSIKATAGKGFTFSNWTGGISLPLGVITNGPTVRFLMESNLMLQANFIDVTKPTLKITAPVSGQHMSNALANVTGTASDNWKVAGVWYQLNGGTWNQPSTTNGWTNWMTTVELQNAANTIKAYAVDTSGNVSTTSTVSFVSSNAFELQLAFTMAQPLTTNGLNFALQVSPKLNGHVEVSTNLVNWITLTNFVGTNSTIEFIDAEATNLNRRFYRAIIP